MSLHVFAYGSLVHAESASMTLGRPVTPRPASLTGWRRRFSQCRDNLACEKSFAFADGSRPRWILGLNIEGGSDPAGAVNGALIELEGEEELARLAVRELRYDVAEVGAAVEPADGGAVDRVLTFTAKREHHAPEPPEGAVILASYAQAVEDAFAALGEGQLSRYRETTGPHPVAVVEAVLVEDAIPAGNPRGW